MLNFADLQADDDAWQYQDDTTNSLVPNPSSALSGLGAAGQEYGMGLRFTDNLPAQGSTLAAAWLMVPMTQASEPNLFTCCIDTDAAGQFSDWATWHAASRTAYVEGTPDYRDNSLNVWGILADVTEPLQAIVDRAGYSASAVVFDVRYDPDGTPGLRQSYYADLSVRSVKLCWATYTPGGGGGHSRIGNLRIK